MNEDFLTILRNARQLKASLSVVGPEKVLVGEEYTDDILPFDLYRNTRQNIEKIADQINKSFYYDIYDGAAILMRRLIEMLLVLAFKKTGEEDSIRGSDGNYLQLSEIINCAIQNRQLDLSRNAKAYLGIFKETGDLSAHNPFHNCRKKDLELIQHKFRSLVEELFYKGGVLT
jgi:hypothetical protein